MDQGYGTTQVKCYPLGTESNAIVKVDMRADSAILHVDWDHERNQYCVWAVSDMPHTALDADEKWEERLFYIVATDTKFNPTGPAFHGDEVLDHHGSFRAGGFIWYHAFEVRLHEDA